MPQMNGVDLLDSIIDINSEVKGIIITGNAHYVTFNKHEYPILDKNQINFFDTVVEKVKEIISNE
jgi:two-component SAPR family response regulator